jgi:hypothetical protein
LGDVQLPPAGGKRTGFRDGLKNLELSKVHW